MDKLKINVLKITNQELPDDFLDRFNEQSWPDLTRLVISYCTNLPRFSLIKSKFPKLYSIKIEYTDVQEIDLMDFRDWEDEINRWLSTSNTASKTLKLNLINNPDLHTLSAGVVQALCINKANLNYLNLCVYNHARIELDALTSSDLAITISACIYTGIENYSPCVDEDFLRCISLFTLSSENEGFRFTVNITPWINIIAFLNINYQRCMNLRQFMQNFKRVSKVVLISHMPQSIHIRRKTIEGFNSSIAGLPIETLSIEASCIGGF